MTDLTFRRDDNGRLLVEKRIEGPGIETHTRPQKTDKEFAEAMAESARQLHDLFLQQIQDPTIGVDAAMNGFSAAFGSAAGGAAYNAGMTHQQMQQNLANVLRNTLGSADATFRNLEGG